MKEHINICLIFEIFFSKQKQTEEVEICNTTSQFTDVKGDKPNTCNIILAFINKIHADNQTKIKP